jgi:tetratricopeptide (TPR) repeat protein
MPPDIDLRGCRITGATADALAAYERALDAFVSWRTGTADLVTEALAASPGFVMAHLLRAYCALAGRDLANVHAARDVLLQAAPLAANERERRHMAALAAITGDDYERCKALLAALLRDHPRDLLALHVLHAVDYGTGDLDGIAARAEGVRSAWSPDVPGYHAVLAMQAFGLQERGEYERAETLAEEALAMQPRDARAVHAMAHVFEMSDRPGQGARWLAARTGQWAAGTVVARHCWWHLALFHLAQGDAARALALYDRRVRAGQPPGASDLVDAAALLWRIALHGGDCGIRWRELSDAWAPRIADGFCSFNDVHAMLAFAGAHDWPRAERLERELESRQWRRTRHGETTRTVGLPACRALLAFGRGRHAEAARLLAALPPLAHRLGGSHAQRDVLHLTLLHALASMRRPARMSRLAA